MSCQILSLLEVVRVFCFWPVFENICFLCLYHVSTVNETQQPCYFYTSRTFEQLGHLKLFFFFFLLHDTID